MKKMTVPLTAGIMCVHLFLPQSGAELVSHTNVVRHASDDSKSVRYVRTYRGGEHIMSTYDQGGKISRIVYVDGIERYAESDETGDGEIDIVIVYSDPALHRYEMFYRDINGALVPAPTDVLRRYVREIKESYRQLGEVIGEMDPAKNMPRQESGEGRKKRGHGSEEASEEPGGAGSP